MTEKKKKFWRRERIEKEREGNGGRNNGLQFCMYGTQWDVIASGVINRGLMREMEGKKQEKSNGFGTVLCCLCCYVSPLCARIL